MTEFHEGMLLGAVLMFFALIAIGGLYLFGNGLHTCPDSEDGTGTDGGPD